MTLLLAPLGALTGGASILALELTNTITLGSVIVGLVVALSTIAAVFYGVRYKVSYEAAAARADQLSSWLEEALDREKRLDERLELVVGELSEARKELATAAATVERLSALENIETIIKLMDESVRRADDMAEQRLEKGLTRVEEAFDTRLERFVHRADEQHESNLAAISGLAASIERRLR